MSIRTDRRDAVAVLTLDRPDALNALSPEMLDDLEAALLRIDADPAQRAIVLTGAGEKAFCAGADIGHMRRATPHEARDFGLRGQGIANLIESIGTPVVAAVNGFALGGGCEIALACDVRLAADSARLGQPEVTLGIIPGWGGTQRLARATRVPRRVALERQLHDARVEQREAGGGRDREADAESGGAAVGLAAQMASRPASAVAAAKRLCNLALGGESPGPYARELDGFALCFGTPDQQEGMEAFIERRPPRFEGHAQPVAS